MTKDFYRLFCLGSLMVFSFGFQTAFGQTEKLGIVKYTPPPGWTRTKGIRRQPFFRRTCNPGSIWIAR